MSAVLQGTAAIMAVVATIYVFSSQKLQEAGRIVKWHELILYRKICAENSILKKYFLPEIEALLFIPTTIDILDKIKNKIIESEPYKEDKRIGQEIKQGITIRDNFRKCEKQQRKNKNWTQRSIFVNAAFLMFTAICLGFKDNFNGYQSKLILIITILFFIILYTTICTVYLLMKDPLSTS